MKKIIIFILLLSVFSVFVEKYIKHQNHQQTVYLLKGDNYFEQIEEPGPNTEH